MNTVVVCTGVNTPYHVTVCNGVYTVMVVFPQTDLSVGVLTVLDKGPWFLTQSVHAAPEPKPL